MTSIHLPSYKPAGKANKEGPPGRSQQGPPAPPSSSTESFHLFQEKVLAPMPDSLPSRSLENEIILLETGDGEKSCLAGKPQDMNAGHFVGQLEALESSPSPAPTWAPFSSPFPHPGLPSPASLQPSVSEPFSELSQYLAHSRCSLNLLEQKNECVHLHKHSFHKYQMSPLCLRMYWGGGRKDKSAHASQTA